MENVTRLEHIQHATEVDNLFEANYGYDAVGNPLYRVDGVDSTLGELYGHDSRNRLRSFTRGTLSFTGGNPTISTPLSDAELPGAESWANNLDLDHRGNWLASSLTLNGTTKPQTRTRNGVNEYLTLDPDGAGSASALTLTHDENGNLTADPSAPNAGLKGDITECH